MNKLKRCNILENMPKDCDMDANFFLSKFISVKVEWYKPSPLL